MTAKDRVRNTHPPHAAMNLTTERGWRLELPEGMYEVRVSAPPECTSMAHLRGEIAPGAPVFGVLSTSEASEESALRVAKRLAGSWTETEGPRATSVHGSPRAARVDGLIDWEREGLTDDGVERIVSVVAELREEIVVLTLRTRPNDPVAPEIERVVGSFDLDPGGR